MDQPVKMLVVGGCRSGKSRYAEEWVEAHFSGDPSRSEASAWKLFVATLEDLGDPEMTHRIALHRVRRGKGWATVEEACDLVRVLAENQEAMAVILIDCLTLWITNLLGRNLSDEEIEREVGRLGAALAACPVTVVLVANEVGLGLVPQTPLGRRFRDLAGWTNQQLAAVCDRVVLVAAGLPLPLKG